MLRSRATAVLSMALFACAPVKEPGPEPEESVPPVAAGCALLGGIRATARSFPLGDGRTLWTLGSNASAITTSAGGPEECFAGTPVDPGPLVQGMPDAEPLAVVRAGITSARSSALHNSTKLCIEFAGVPMEFVERAEDIPEPIPIARCPTRCSGT